MKCVWNVLISETSQIYLFVVDTNLAVISYIANAFGVPLFNLSLSYIFSFWLCTQSTLVRRNIYIYIFLYFIIYYFTTPSH